MNRRLLLPIAGITLLLAGCTFMHPRDFEQRLPRLVLEEYFTQPLEGRGAIFFRNGTLKTMLTVKAHGEWDGRILTLQEHITYDSGEPHHRTFIIRKIDDHHYEATCDEFVGPGTMEVYGNTLRWRYYLKERSREAHGITLFVDDWLFLSPDGHLIDHGIISRFGVTLGHVFMSIGPQR